MLYALLTFSVCDHEMLTDNRMLLQDPLFYFLSSAYVSPLSDIEYEVSILSFMLYETTCIYLHFILIAMCHSSF